MLAIGMTFGDQTAPGLTSVQLELRDDENAHRLSLGEHQTEPGRGPSLALNGARDVEIAGVPVRRHNRPPEPGWPDGLRLASWVACGLEFGLGGPFTEFSGPEFEAVVASIIEACEGERASGVR
ncbi:MAG: hypothetical protein R3C39_11545 [Dehalococcoidia bacterium]